MADGRLVKNKISKSGRVNRLPFGAALLFTWMITHLDCEGRMHGNPRVVKNVVLPLRPISVKQVDGWLNEMAAMTKNGHGLIVRYEVEGEKYIWMPGFEDEQTNLRKDRERKSVIPPPPDHVAPPPAERPQVEAKSVTADILDENLAAVVKSYEQNVGMATPAIYERLKDIASGYPERWFQDALAEALNHGKRSLSYMERILERWHTEGKDAPRQVPKAAAAKASGGMKEEE